ncbi:hypothetical protein [Streptomyces sp. NPDC005423]|uniref:hypothetical protein n=1 Tax=Streptomyces sp. NPDC005423 TaxID=3155343 RepID=UPI0033ACAEF1
MPTNTPTPQPGWKGLTVQNAREKAPCLRFYANRAVEAGVENRLKRPTCTTFFLAGGAVT